MPIESSEQILCQVRDQLTKLLRNRQIGDSIEITGFPNSQRTYRRVDFIVCPLFSINPRGLEGLEKFRRLLGIDAEPFDNQPFQLTSRGHLRLGSLTYKEQLPGQRKTYQVTTINLSDPILQGPWPGLSQQRLEKEEPLVGLVGIRPYPNRYLLNRVAEYEYDLLEGYAREDLELNKLRAGINARLIQEMETDRAFLPKVQILTKEERRQITLEDR